MNTKPTTDIRALARDLVEAKDAYSAAYRITMDATLDVWDRADAEIALNAAAARMCAANRALSDAQKVSA